MNPDSTLSDILLFQINGDPGLSPLNLASASPTNDTQVYMVGFGQSGQPNLSYWIDDGGPWILTVAGDPAANRIGYQWTGVQPGLERWGSGSVAGSTECQPAVIALDHVQLAMPKGEERLAEEFYCELLGFQKVTKPSHLEQRGGCWFTANGVNLHLRVDPQFVPARKAHPGFVVKSLSALKNRLEAAGIEIVWDTQISGFERFYASDPFGNRLEFMEPTDSPRNTRSL